MRIYPEELPTNLDKTCVYNTTVLFLKPKKKKVTKTKTDAYNPKLKK